MSISYAYIRYLKDQEREIVNVNHIKNFHPEHELDFIPNKAYMVQWLAIDSDDETEIDSNLQDPDSWYKAQILLLAASRKELEKKLEGTRVKVSKVFDTSVEDSSEDESASSSLRQEMLDSGKARKEKKKEQQKAKSSSLKKLLSERLECRKRSAVFGDEPEMKRKCHGLEMKNQELMTRNKELGAKMKEVQDLNIRLQRALLEKLSCPHCEKKDVKDPRNSKEVPTRHTTFPPSSPEIVPEEEPCGMERSDRPSKYKTTGDKVHIGQNVWLPVKTWEMLQLQNKNSVFVKNLAVAIWGSDKLKDKSVDGKACNRFKGNAAKPPLSPVKLDTMKACYEDRLERQNLSKEEFAIEQKKFKKFITEKIMDLNRTQRKKDQ
ncbi:BEN domain-containing protein 5-like [Apostichopus japonicus]|uniref:BEN domain-containing protein 5-like n=1 Tax=Stichopus japonicus TaxID=307972 RepID=UPI003AB62998